MNAVHMRKLGYLEEAVPAASVRDQMIELCRVFGALFTIVRPEELDVLSEGEADALRSAAEPDEVAPVHEGVKPFAPVWPHPRRKNMFLPGRGRRGPSEELLQPSLEVLQ